MIIPWWGMGNGEWGMGNGEWGHGDTGTRGRGDAGTRRKFLPHPPVTERSRSARLLSEVEVHPPNRLVGLDSREISANGDILVVATHKT